MAKYGIPNLIDRTVKMRHGPDRMPQLMLGQRLDALERTLKDNADRTPDKRTTGVFCERLFDKTEFARLKHAIKLIGPDGRPNLSWLLKQIKDARIMVDGNIAEVPLGMDFGLSSSMTWRTGRIFIDADHSGRYDVGQKVRIASEDALYSLAVIGSIGVKRLSEIQESDVYAIVDTSYIDFQYELYKHSCAFPKRMRRTTVGMLDWRVKEHLKKSADTQITLIRWNVIEV